MKLFLITYMAAAYLMFLVSGELMVQPRWRRLIESAAWPLEILFYWVWQLTK